MRHSWITWQTDCMDAPATANTKGTSATKHQEKKKTEAISMQCASTNHFRMIFPRYRLFLDAQQNCFAYHLLCDSHTLSPYGAVFLFRETELERVAQTIIRFVFFLEKFYSFGTLLRLRFIADNIFFAQFESWQKICSSTEKTQKNSCAKPKISGQIFYGLFLSDVAYGHKTVMKQPSIHLFWHRSSFCEFFFSWH